MKKIISLKKEDIAVLSGLLLLAVFNVIRAADLPGLYYDAVNPDYMAVQVLNPGENTIPIYTYFGVPLLGSLYHGTVTMFGTMLSIFITGRTGMFQLRCMNALYGLVICFLVYKILKRVNVRKYLTIACPVLIMLSPHMFSYFRTVYYMELPGACFYLIAAWKFLDWIETKDKRKLIYCGVWGGLAFYSYFCWLFWLVPLLITIIYTDIKTKTSFWEDIHIFIISCGIGSGLYYIGYGGSIIDHLPVQRSFQVVLFILYILAFFFCFGIMLSIQISEKKSVLFKRWSFRAIIALVVVFIIGIFFIGREKLLEVVGAVNIIPRKAGLVERLGLVAEYIRKVVTNDVMEKQLAGYSSSIFPYALLLFAGISIPVTIFAIIKKKNSTQKEKIFIWLVWASVVYYVLCLILAQKMEPMHFVMFTYICFMLVVVGIDVVWDCFGDKNTGIIKCVAAGMVIMFLVLNTYNQSKLLLAIQNTGGNGTYTENVNKLAYNAMERRNEGMQELYVFPAWGFAAEFNYLTMNNIRYLYEIDETICNDYLKKGYRINMCLWNSGDNDQYIKEFSDIMPGKVSQEKLVNRRGDVDIVVYYYEAEELQ